MSHFRLLKKSKNSKARLGILKTAHGSIKTPFFIPVATQGAVKHISAMEAKKLGARILLSNTYHLMLRPGEKLIRKQGGLHKFMDWSRPILTDSGGFQIFSLAGSKNKSGENLVKLNRDGVKFKSFIDGNSYYLTPEKSLKIQMDLGVDIAVCLDECVAMPATKEYIKKSVELTSYWAQKTKNYFNRLKADKIKKNSLPLLFAVIQGGLDKESRLKSLDDLVKIGFDGYNVGGLSVGETSDEMREVLDYLCPRMPAGKPRYLMGVGYPENILEAVKRGIDMFDCVIPTREGRHGKLFFWKKILNNQFQKSFYKTVNITRTKFANDSTSINLNSKLPELRQYSKAYLHYLFKIKEPLGRRLASLNNLEFYLDLMGKIRQDIKSGNL